MEQLPSNSHNQRREPAEEPKKIEKVVVGEVVTRKKPFFRRFGDTFFTTRADVVADHVFWDVLVPAAKNMIADGASSFIDRMIFGEEAGPRGRASSVIKTVAGGIGTYASNNQTPYHRINSGAPAPSSPGISYRGRATHDFKEIVIPTRPEAEVVLDNLFRRIVDYNSVTIADFYELCGITPNYTDDKYGWTNIQGSGILRVRDGFVLDLPRPEPLD